MTENTENLNLDKISQRVHQTNFIDGFAFIYIGLILMIASAIININFSQGLVILVIVSEVLRPTLSKILRNRFTYPRLGNFKVKSEETRKEFPRVILFMTLIIMVSLIVIFIIEGGNIYRFYSNIWKYGPIIFGLIMFGPSIDLVKSTGQEIYYGMGIFSTVLGIFILMLDFSSVKYGFVVYLTILGFIFFLIGLIIFLQFIITYPIIPDIEETIDEELI